MRIFTRYILREITGYALLGGVLFTFILFMKYLLQLMELAVRGVATPADLLRLVGYLLPSLFTVTIPMAVLIGILLGLSRLSADSEVTAMRASGLGVLSFVRIVSILAVFAWGVGLLNSLYVAPRAAQALLNYEKQSHSALETVEVQPRVFYEHVKDSILYVQDVLPGPGNGAIWHNVFLANLKQPASPLVVTAKEAVVLPGNGQEPPRVELSDGSRHDYSTNNPNEYQIYTFKSTEQPLQSSQQEDTHISRLDTGREALPLGEVWKLMHGKVDARLYTIEFNRRFSFPTACLVLMLVGVPLGLSSKRGGKGSGFVVTLVLVFVYYFLSIIGTALARQDKVPAALGVWGANLLFAGAGLLLIQQMSRGSFALDLAARSVAAVRRLFTRLGSRHAEHSVAGSDAGMQRLRRALRIRFPLILDEYVMTSFLRNFALVLASFTALFLIFTFFELIGDIIKYRTPLVTVGDYLFNLIPFILYNVTPICSLIAVLITFGALSRSSELTAMKATGMSLYRIITPVLLVAALISVGLFAFDEVYLPGANRRQQALLDTIRGKPAQTYLRPDRQWMSGPTSDDGEPARIFYYQYFDPYKNVFGNLTVFEFEPGSFTLTRRIFASDAHWDEHINRWVLENGWQRTFSGDAIGHYDPFTIESFPEIHEQPAYFKKEDRQSQEMSYTELQDYISDLKQSGFDTVRLRVQLNRKLAYPLVTLVMAILAIPFSLSAGKRGSIAGMGSAIGIAIVYWVALAVFENLGDVNTLPAVLAAWSPDVLFAVVGSWLLLRTPT